MLIKKIVGMVSLVILLAIIVACSVPWLLTLYDPYEINFTDKLMEPNATHLLGTDEMGRDLLARVLYGGRVTIWSALIITAGSILIATVWGAVSAYVGGTVDELMTRIVDTLMNIPSLLLVLLLVSILSPGMTSLVISLMVIRWTGYARIIRGQVFTVLGAEFIQAARSVGATPGHIVRRHIIPNTWFLVVTLFGLNFGSTILSISSLNFLGFGVRLPYAEWGAMINYARPFLQTKPYLIFFPGLAIVVTILATNLSFNFIALRAEKERVNHL
jgi:ABC-type dipeptide/oligopeptide/nickel transport system permease subunit